MKESVSERYLLLLYLTVWSLLYFVLGYFSLLLDDPASRVTLVWFPAGVAVSAFLSTQKKHWHLIYLLLFLTRSLLDMAVRHSPGTSLALSLISLSCDLSIAWSINRFASHTDDLRKVVVWLIAVCLFSAVAALAGTSWLAFVKGISIVHSIGIWWAANVVGNIVSTTVMTGLIRVRRASPKKHWLTALVGAILMTASTVLIFSMPPFSAEQVGIVYSLACIPVLFTVMVPVISSDRAGALVYSLFCTLVIYFSWQQTGPFFIKGLSPGDPLLIAQCYLAGTALLMIFIRIQTYSLLDGKQVPQSNKGEMAYYLDMATGAIHWDPSTNSDMNKIISEINTRDALFARVATSVKKDIAARWQLALTGMSTEKEYHFQIKLDGGEDVSITERNLVCLPGQQGIIIIGYWSPSRPLITLKTGHRG